jgi:hypothetical protein
MGKRGPKPKGKVKIKWSANFAYAIGLIATDGCLSNDGLHITFVSKDREQIENFMRCLGVVGVKIGETFSDHKKNMSFRVQFGDVLFYEFLQNIGITRAKSLTIGRIKIPDEYFFDFLRGCFDGDGCSYSYWDPRWRSSFMFYISFASASKVFVDWIQESVHKFLNLHGHITFSKRGNGCYQLRYAKKEGITLAGAMYYGSSIARLSRKYLKIRQSLAIVQGQKAVLLTK